MQIDVCQSNLYGFLDIVNNIAYNKIINTEVSYKIEETFSQRYLDQSSLLCRTHLLTLITFKDEGHTNGIVIS